MSQSTPLDMLESGEAPMADEERVKRILAQMNVEDTVQAPPQSQQASGNHIPPPVAFRQMPSVITEPPIAMSTGQLRMDRDTARANVIGNSIPTMADFQSMFHPTPPGLAPFHGPAAATAPALPPASKQTDWKTLISEYLRGPIAVAIIVFFLNLPVVTSMLSRYASWMYLSSGEISIGGLLVKALLGAVIFTLYQGVSSFVGAK
jgi:hypothetical protein